MKLQYLLGKHSSIMNRCLIQHVVHTSRLVEAKFELGETKLIASNK